ncbi:putative membrane protein [Synechococcus sp. MEDNS5]|nr:putative membrane protein [Synechococcus sp. MEDNS5]
MLSLLSTLAVGMGVIVLVFRWINAGLSHGEALRRPQATQLAA